MLQTINGFDLLLVLVIVGLLYKVSSLTRECESYVGQIIKMSWELQEVNEKLFPSYPDFCDFCTDSKPREINPECTCCVYCLGIEEKVTGDECFCAPF